jgi:hypothetical protein
MGILNRLIFVPEHCASLRATIVFPVPGGPCNSTCLYDALDDFVFLVANANFVTLSLSSSLRITSTK